MQSKVGSNLSNEISKEVDAIICEHKDKPENMPYLSSMIKLVSDDEDTFDLANLSDELAVKTVKTLIMIPFCITLIILANVVFILFRKFVSKLPGYSVISGIDRFLGLICGTVQGIVLVGVIFVAVSFLQFIPSGNFLNEQFNSSAIVILINDLLF